MQEEKKNKEKHAKERAKTNKIEEKSEKKLVEIKENGSGVVPKKQAGEKALGLAGMRDRVEALGGVLCVESGIDCGTTIRIKLPLNG